MMTTQNDDYDFTFTTSKIIKTLVAKYYFTLLNA